VSERVFVLGAGRAGRGLARALRLGGVDVTGLHGRHAGDPDDRATVGALPDTIGGASTVLVTVRDAQLDEALRELGRAPLRADAVVLHASGSADPPALAGLRSLGHAAGTFHPLVPLSDPARAPALLRDAWIGLDGDDAARARGRALADALGAHTLDIPAGRKPLYHAAAVIASNYAVTLVATGADLLARCGLEPDAAVRALLPLLQGTLANLATLGVPEALTGPLSRGDTGTVARHLAHLDAVAPEAAALYRALGLATVPIALHKNPAAAAQIAAARALLARPAAEPTPAE